jgi:hypothetical protein
MITRGRGLEDEGWRTRTRGRGPEDKIKRTRAVNDNVKGIIFCKKNLFLYFFLTVPCTTLHIECSLFKL